MFFTLWADQTNGGQAGHRGIVRLRGADSGQRATDRQAAVTLINHPLTAKISLRTADHIGVTSRSGRSHCRSAIICNFLCLIGVLREAIHQAKDKQIDMRPRRSLYASGPKTITTERLFS